MRKFPQKKKLLNGCEFRGNWCTEGHTSLSLYPYFPRIIKFSEVQCEKSAHNTENFSSSVKEGLGTAHVFSLRADMQLHFHMFRENVQYLEQGWPTLTDTGGPHNS